MAGFEGGCLCGAVRYRSEADPVLTAHCHCEDCRRTSGTGHGTHVVIPTGALTVRGRVSLYERPADSGHVVGRAFCPTCGSALYSTNETLPELRMVRASSLDDLEVVDPKLVVYASRAASWDHMYPSLPRFEKNPDRPAAEVLAEFG